MNKIMTVGEKVVTGYWDGQEIYRKRTAQEVLLNELKNNEDKRLEELNKKQYEPKRT